MRQRKLQAQADSVALAEDVTGGLRRTRQVCTAGGGSAVHWSGQALYGRAFDHRQPPLFLVLVVWLLLSSWQVLAEELEHTSATLAAMEASHAGLGKTRDEYHGQHRQLKRSKGLLGALNWQAKSVSGGELIVCVCRAVPPALPCLLPCLLPCFLCGRAGRRGIHTGHSLSCLPALPAVTGLLAVPPACLQEAYLLWFGLTIFLAVCAYVFQKRAGHFVPARLKPSALLSATGLPAYLRGDGRPAVRQPQGLRRPQAQPPLRKARGSGMQDPGGAPVQQMPEATQQESAGVPPTPPSVPPPQLQVSPEAADEQAVWPSAGPPAAQEVPAAAAEEVPAVPATQEAPAVSAHEMPAATEQEQHVLPVATEQQQPTEEAGMEHAAVAKQQEPAAAAVEQQQQQEPAAAAAVQEHQAGEGVAAPVDAAVGPEGAPQLPPDSTAPTVMQEQQPVAAEAAEGRPVEGAPPPPPPQQQGSSTIIHDPRGRPIAVDSAKDFVQQPPPAQAQAAEEEAVAAGQAGAAEAPPVDAAREEL
jgi:hypothetical protein